MASSRHGVRLEWVVNQGIDTHVSAFRHVQPGHRPEVFCPECADPLVLRLGEVRAWHAAHQNAGRCTLTHPESALHLNTKMRLAEQLRQAAELSIVEQCGGTKYGRAGDCEIQRTRLWAAGWSSVEVERTVQTRRPDIVLLRGEEVVGAIEVWVSHKVEPDKRACFAEWGMPWIEVAAHEGLIQGETAWKAGSPLAIASSGPVEVVVCDACRRHTEAYWQSRAGARAKVAELVEEQKRQRLSELYRTSALHLDRRTARDGVRVERILPFHRHLPGGEVQRDVLVLADVLRDGARVESFVGVASDLTVIHRSAGHLDSLGYEELRTRAERHLQGLREAGGTIDADPTWFALPRVLRDPDFLNEWSQAPRLLRRAAQDSPPVPWSVSGADEGSDWLDLLDFFRARYLGGLPLRYRWSQRNQQWFQPPILGEEVWRLWPEVPPLPLP